MKTIIVATDFSASAQNAAYYAVDMASAIEADILLLHVYPIPVSSLDIPLTTSLDELMSDAKKSLSELKEKLIERASTEIRIGTEVIAGNLFPGLKEICEKIKPYTVVMGSQGTTGAERVIFGSNTVYAMKHLAWPLVTVPPGVAFSQIKKICLACDFDDVIESTPVEEIKKLVNDFHAELHVVNSGREESYQPDMVFESGMLQEMLMSLKPEYHFITNENADEGIISFVEENNFDLLITLPKRRGVIEKLMHRSFSKQLILHSQVPVFAIQTT